MGNGPHGKTIYLSRFIKANLNPLIIFYHSKVMKSLSCLCLGVFIIAQSFAQKGEHIPFDWSGQNGMSTYRGFLLWNSDWTSNELLFDGTFQSYPLRFGEFIAQDSYHSNSSIFPYSFLHDSTEIKTSFDYRQGDYLFDQISVNAAYKKNNKDIELNGFKRSYGGPYSQFIQPENQKTGVITPNQQSYFFRYLTGENNNMSGISIGRFITNSGLYSAADANGKHVNEITTASFSSQNQWKQYDFRLRFSQYLESRKWITNLSSQPLHYLNRGQLVGTFTPVNKDEGLWELFFSGNTQALTYQDTSISKGRTWISIGGNINKNLLLIEGGIDAGKGYILPRFLVSMNHKKKSINWSSTLELKNNPQHMFVWNLSRSLFETWITGKTELAWELDNIILYNSVNIWRVNNLITNELVPTESSRDLYSIRTGIDWYLPIGINVSGFWTHNSKGDLISDGIGDRIHTEIKFGKFLFADNMELTASLITEGLFNRDSSFGFDSAMERPFIHDWGPYMLSDYWTTHLILKAKVSSVVMSFRILNMFHAEETLFKKIYPELPEEWIRPRNNSYFLPMGQLVSFGVAWEFDD